MWLDDCVLKSLRYIVDSQFLISCFKYLPQPVMTKCINATLNTLIILWYFLHFLWSLILDKGAFTYYCVAVSYAYFFGVFVSDKSDIDTELYQVTYTPPELPKRLLNNSRGTIVASFRSLTISHFILIWFYSLRVFWEH